MIKYFYVIVIGFLIILLCKELLNNKKTTQINDNSQVEKLNQSLKIKINNSLGFFVKKLKGITTTKNYNKLNECISDKIFFSTEYPKNKSAFIQAWKPHDIKSPIWELLRKVLQTDLIVEDSSFAYFAFDNIGLKEVNYYQVFSDTTKGVNILNNEPFYLLKGEVIRSNIDSMLSFDSMYLKNFTFEVPFIFESLTDYKIFSDSLNGYVYSKDLISIYAPIVILSKESGKWEISEIVIE